MALLSDTTLGIDFGTSNSALSVRHGVGPARLIAVEGEALTMPTALFFDAEEQRTHFGRDAVAQYLAGVDGRLMRSLKSLLGSSLLQEKTVVHQQWVTYQDILTLFMRKLAQSAQQALGGMPPRVVLGRPVHFVDDDAERDQQAQEALREAAREAGFGDVSFEFEPMAAALDYEQRLDRESLVLVVDVGGGTSDFTVVRLGPGRAGADRRSDVLATTGVHVGGTDFDRRLSLDVPMPLLGFRHRGPAGREVPSGVFFDLATWHLIPWRYAARAMRDAQALRENYQDVRLHDRLMRVLQERQGHRLADDVERTKIAVSISHEPATLALDWLEPCLQVVLAPAQLADSLQAALAQVVACAARCVQLAGLLPQDLDAVYLTGGSCALRPLRHALALAFPGVEQVEGDLMGGVATGLALSGR